MDLSTVRWLVIVVVLYTAFTMLLSARLGRQGQGCANEALTVSERSLP